MKDKQIAFWILFFVNLFFVAVMFYFVGTGRMVILPLIVGVLNMLAVSLLVVSEVIG